MMSLAIAAQYFPVQVSAAVLLVLYIVVIRKDDFGVSVLDNMQKSAQGRELDHNSAKPWLFVTLSVIQVLVMIVSSLYFFDTFGHFAAVGCSAVAAHVVGFVIATLTKSNALFDITGEVVFAFLLAFSYYSQINPSPRQQVVFGLAGVWVFRLGVFLFARIIERGHDWRFDKLVKSNSYNAFGWICQGSWIWMNGFCLWLIAGVGSRSGSASTPLRYLLPKSMLRIARKLA